MSVSRLSRKTRRIALLILVLIPTVVYGQSKWYESAHFECADPYRVRQAASHWLKELPFTVTTISQNRGFIRVSAESYFKLAQPGYVVWDSINVTGPMAEGLRKIFEPEHHTRLALAIKIPGDFLIGLLQGGWGTLITKVMDFLISSGARNGITPEALQPLIAEGGRLQRVYDARLQENKRPYLAERIIYEVNVGKEQRYVTTSACVYPVFLEIRQIETRIPMNNKRFILEGKIWRRQDVEGNRMEATYVEYDRDESFLYLERTDGDNKGRRERISQLGGPWQSLTDGKWITFADKTQPY